MIAKTLRLMREVVRVNTDTVTSDKSGFEWKEIPFRSRGLEHFVCINTHAFEDQCKLVDEGDVNITLRVFNDLSSFRDFYRRCFVSSCDDDFLIKLIYFLSDLRRASAGDFFDCAYTMLFIT